MNADLSVRPEQKKPGEESLRRRTIRTKCVQQTDHSGRGMEDILLASSHGIARLISDLAWQITFPTQKATSKETLGTAACNQSISRVGDENKYRDSLKRRIVRSLVFDAMNEIRLEIRIDDCESLSRRTLAPLEGKMTLFGLSHR